MRTPVQNVHLVTVASRDQRDPRAGRSIPNPFPKIAARDSWRPLADAGDTDGLLMSSAARDWPV